MECCVSFDFKCRGLVSNRPNSITKIKNKKVFSIQALATNKNNLKTQNPQSLLPQPPFGFHYQVLLLDPPLALSSPKFSLSCCFPVSPFYSSSKFTTQLSFSLSLSSPFVCPFPTICLSLHPSFSLFLSCCSSLLCKIMDFSLQAALHLTLKFHFPNLSL